MAEDHHNEKGLPRRRLIYVLLPTLGAVLILILVLAYWNVEGRRELAWQLSTFHVLRHYLVERAKQEGRYPESMSDAVPEGFLCGVDLSNLNYVARGKPYPLQGDGVVFCEKTPRSYGFQTGRLVFYEANRYALIARDRSGCKQEP